MGSEREKNNGRRGFIAFCILPGLLLFAVFFFYPMAEVFRMCFYNWSGLATEKFIGWDNFKTLIHDPYFWICLKNNFILLLIVPTITMSISLFFANALARYRLKEKGFYRMILFLPNIMSLVIISLLWMFIYHPSMGILNSFLQMVGLGRWAIGWLGDKTTVLGAIGMAMVWQAFGYYMVFYMAGIAEIPLEFYEAAILDGAGNFQQFIYVTFPMIWEVVRITIIFFIINVFNQSFTFIMMMSNGGPDYASEVLTTYMYRQGFMNGNYGYATAVGVSTFLFTIVLALISNKFTDRETVQF